MNENKKIIFIADLQQFINKREKIEAYYKDSLNCCNMFDDENIYEEEQQLISLVMSTRRGKTTE